MVFIDIEPMVDFGLHLSDLIYFLCGRQYVPIQCHSYLTPFLFLVGENNVDWIDEFYVVSEPVSADWAKHYLPEVTRLADEVNANSEVSWSPTDGSCRIRIWDVSDDDADSFIRSMDALFPHSPMAIPAPTEHADPDVKCKVGPLDWERLHSNLDRIIGQLREADAAVRVEIQYFPEELACLIVYHSEKAEERVDEILDEVRSSN